MARIFGCAGLLTALLLVVGFAEGQFGGQGGPGRGQGGPGGPGGKGFMFAPPKPGEILPKFIQEKLKLTSEQKKKIDDLQKEVDSRLAEILTEQQKKTLNQMRPPGPGGFPGGQGGGFKGKGPPPPPNE